MFVNGRKSVFAMARQTVNNDKPLAWFHCASLGEFEQARPIIESFRQRKPDYKILITFFSPSGYEIRKNYSEADHVFYLPYDTAVNAKEWLDIIQPSIVFFIKYEFWYHYFNEIEKRGVPLISASSIFRNDQIYFKSFGRLQRSILQKVTHFFVQNKISEDLLNSIDINNVTISGDTRFDRVAEIARGVKEIPIADTFTANQTTWIIGSMWQEDLDVMGAFINHDEQNYKYIIAPHEITQAGLNKIEKQLSKSVIRYSEAELDNIANYDVLLIDNIGMLSSLYQYGDYAFIGGAFGKGLHNILEAATFEMPIFFGNRNYKKFKEATDLIQQEGAFAVVDYHDLAEKFKLLNHDIASTICRSYVVNHTGATQKIIDKSLKLLEA